MGEKTVTFELTEDQAKIVLRAMEHYVRWRESNGFFGPKDSAEETKIRETRKIFRDKLKSNS